MTLSVGSSGAGLVPGECGVIHSFAVSRIF
jgi:hypothetical protein